MSSLRGLTVSVAVLGAAVAGTSGCVIESPPPEAATLRIVATGEVQVVTSSRFNSVFTFSAGSWSLSDEVAFLEADTVLVTGSHERTFVLSDPPRLFVRATSLSDANDIAMEVRIEGRRLYDLTRTLEADESLQHVFCAISLAHPWTSTATDPNTPWADMPLGCGRL